MHGVISAGNPQTVEAGLSILGHGGNAVDAAVAAAFASFIAEPGVVHLGGSGMAQIFAPQGAAEGAQHVVYDFFSAMPGLERRRAVENLDFERVTIDYGATTQHFHLGRGSVAVPGNISGLCRMAADFGRLPLRTLLQPAITLAREGAVLDDFQAATCELLRPLYTHTAGMRAIFAPQGAMVRSGDRFFIPHLAETLQALAAEGAAAARSGSLARALLADQQENGGLLTAADLEQFRVQRHAPIRLAYRDCHVLLPPPSSSGGVLIAFALKILSRFTLQDTPHNSARHLQLLYETMAAAARARPTWERLSAQLPPEAAVARFLAQSSVAPHVERVRRALALNQPSTATGERRGPSHTSHLSVVDAQGMAVALTTTAGETAGYVVPQTGFIPNNILGEEDLNPGGFHQWRPGQRIPTMMAPTIVLRDERIRLVTGSGGSNRIRSAILQVLSNVLDYDMDLPGAVRAPRVHLEDGVLQCEHGYDPQAVARLEAMGYPVNRWPVRSIYFG
ncbi:MAG TPA: gamma-glutamyltransferase, partial [Candidatus Sulfomarinibacteraceae bacterium]|nr:gamma-glutamyltransferase [Candidatus Sulfomarinibacteraceae bacterium]